MLRIRVMPCALLLLACAASCDDDDTPECENWSYEHDQCGPPWNENSEWSECVHGAEQSPIDIHGATRGSKLSPLDYDYPVLPAPTVRNNGHTIQVDYDAGTLHFGAEVYTTTQFHVHAPAEHAVDGARAALEVHIVHADSTGTPAAVVAVRLVESEANPFLAHYFDVLPDEQGEVTGPEPLDLAELMPERGDYWTYAGSLTTPPCSEGLRWIVMEQPGTASRPQIDAILDRFDENARELQPLHERAVEEYRGG